MKLCKKTVIGDLTAGDVQRTTISCLGIPILERRRVLLASVPIPSISGGTMCAEVLGFKNTYYFLKIPFWVATHTLLSNQRYSYNIHYNVSPEEPDFAAICNNAERNKNLKEKVLRLCANLPIEDQKMVVRQVALSRKAWETGNFWVHHLTQKEISERERLDREFFPNIFKIADDLYFYDGYFLPQGAFGPSVFFYKHGLRQIFSQKTLDNIRQKDIIDAGGFLADSAIIFEREFCDKTIYSFEPTSKQFALMQQTLKLNNSKRVVPINKGIGAASTTQNILVGGGASSFARENNTDTKETAKIVSIDEFVSANNLQIGFIKADVEGFEQELLKGAKHTICTQKPALLISLYHNESDYFDIKPMIESWNLGYKMRIYKGTDISLFHEVALYCEAVD